MSRLELSVSIVVVPMIRQIMVPHGLESNTRGWIALGRWLVDRL